MAHEPAGPPNLKFIDIHLQERQEIEKRRGKQSYCPGDRSNPTFVGMALSGGGIRSATFCLGFLQELHRLRLLRIFDYLSTVSGGGYLGGWWSAWLSRSEEGVREVKCNPNFTTDEIHNEMSLLLKISEAAEPVSQALLEQLENDYEGRSILERLYKRELDINPPGLSKLLRDHLNTYISRQSPAPVPTDDREEAEANQRRAEELRWAARVRLVDTFPNELRNVFPPPENIEPHRARSPQEKASDGSRCAWEDPVHHLRLFANYLTPRKGMLSADTWRAISAITRNLALTWLILLPLLIGVMLLGQAYFLLNGSTRWAFINPHNKEALTVLFLQILIPVGVLLTSSIMMAIAWLLCNRDNSSSQDSTVQTTCMIALAGILVSAAASISSLTNWFANLLAVRHLFFVSIRMLRPEDVPPVIQLRLIAAWIVVILGAILFMWYWKLDERSFPPADPETLSTWKRDVRRGRFSRAQARLLVLTAIVAAVLLLSWFSCFLAKDHSLNIGWKIPFTLVPLLSAIGGSIFTALRATPMTNGNRSLSREPTMISRLIFASTPPLVVAVLAVMAAWFSHWLIVYYVGSDLTNAMDAAGLPLKYQHFWDIRGFLKLATVLSIGLCMGLALYEMQSLKWSKILRPALAPIVFICLLMININWGGQAAFHYASENPGRDWSLFLSTCLGALITIFVFRRVIPKGKWKWRLFRRLNLVRKAPKETDNEHGRIIQKLRFGSALGAISLTLILTFMGYLIGRSLYWLTVFKTTGSILRAVVISLVALAGGLVVFRLLITRTRRNGETIIALHFFKDKTLGQRPEALWFVASICLTLPIALMSAAHYIKWNGVDHPLTTAPFRFPAFVGLLLLTMMVLRSLVIQKLLVQQRPIVPWSVGVFDWLLGKIPRVKKHSGVAYQLLALLAICLTPLLDLAIRAATGDPLTIAMVVAPINWKVATVALFVSVPVFGVSIFQIPVRGGLYELFNCTHRRLLHSQTFLWVLASLCIVWAFLAGLYLPSWLYHVSETTSGKGFITVLLPVASGCFLIVLFEIYWGRRDNRRSLNLIAFAYAAIALVFFIRLSGAGPEWQLVPGLLAAICVWVGALGWMVDPNAVSMHQFYKGRLVRAYLGASNVRRLLHRTKEITETVAGDDIPLKALKNCDRGGPYHLINTTLNLVAGRDLATAQRSASSFVLSQKYCGSARTNYCSTEEYMDGQLTLGTAVAASGAAVSPNMGAKKPTAALAMLMTLLNVRLGYWAPTPNGDGWNSSQPRLWPFYLVREFLSQTNDLSDYCYLTDGGHFDNTGLYSLIERGCKYVVLVDCGADPKPCFEDFGEAIRRCRIDFGTEIELSLDSFIESPCTKGDECFAMGKIHFSPDHLRDLGHEIASTDDESLTGIIVYFKPAVIRNVTPDVRQYAIENENFPQQPTTNQWFGEAQFESYRRLGQLCANRAFDFELVREMSESPEVSLRSIEKLFESVGSNNGKPQK